MKAKSRDEMVSVELRMEGLRVNDSSIDLENSSDEAEETDGLSEESDFQQYFGNVVESESCLNNDNTSSAAVELARHDVSPQNPNLVILGDVDLNARLTPSEDRDKQGTNFFEAEDEPLLTSVAVNDVALDDSQVMTGNRESDENYFGRSNVSSISSQNPTITGSVSLPSPGIFRDDRSSPPSVRVLAAESPCPVEPTARSLAEADVVINVARSPSSGSYGANERRSQAEGETSSSSGDISGRSSGSSSGRSSGSSGSMALSRLSGHSSTTTMDKYAVRLLHYEKRIRSLEEERAELMADNASLRHNSAQTALKSQREQRSVAIKQRQAAELKEARKMLHQVQQSSSVLETELSALKESLQNKDEHCQKLYRDLALERDRVRSMTALKSKVDADLEAAGCDAKEILELREELEHRRELVQTHAAVAEQLREELRERDRAAEDADIRRRDLEQHVTKLQYRLQELEAQDAALRERSNDVDGLVSYKHWAQNELAQLQNERVANHEEAERLRQAHARLVEEDHSLRVVLKDRELEVESLTNKVSQLTVRLDEASCRSPPTAQPQRSAVVVELTTRVESLMADRERLQALVDSMRAEVSSRDLVIEQQRGELADGGVAEVNGLRESVRCLTAETERLKGEMESLRADAQENLSFRSPGSHLSEEGSQMDASLEKAVTAMHTLMQCQLCADCRRRMAEPSRGDGEGEGEGEGDDGDSFYRQICEMVLAQDVEDSPSRPDNHKGTEILQNQLSKLQEIAAHESKCNAELRELLETCDREASAARESLQSKLEAAQSQLSDVRHEMELVQSWTRRIGRSLNVPLSDGEHIDAGRDCAAIEMAVVENLRAMDTLRATAAKLPAVERLAASVRLQKSAVLKVYAMRGERAPGVPWVDERVPLTMRTAAQAVLAAVRLRGLALESESPSPTAVCDVSRYYSVAATPPVWRTYDRSAPSPGDLRGAVTSLERKLAERDQRIDELSQRPHHTAACKYSESGDRYLTDLIIEKRRLAELLEKEMTSSTKKTEHLLRQWRAANEEVEKAQLEAHGEREARRAAEAKLRSYVQRLESYSNTVRRLRAEHETLSKSVKTVAGRQRESPTLDSGPAGVGPAGVGLAAAEDRSSGDIENCDPGGPGTPAKGRKNVLHDLRERQRRANKLVVTLARSARKDLDQARSQSTKEGDTLAQQIEDYIFSLNTVSRKLNSTRTGAATERPTPFANLSNLAPL